MRKIYSWLKAEITVKTCGDEFGHLFNNTILNVSTSTIGVAVTGENSARSLFKGMGTLLPWSKALYFTSSALSTTSSVSSALCLMAGYSCVAPVPLMTAFLGYITSVSARACNALASCLDTANGLKDKAIDVCIDAQTRNMS